MEGTPRGEGSIAPTSLSAPESLTVDGEATEVDLAIGALLKGVDKARLMRTAERLAGWVRLSGSDEERAAVKYAAALLDKGGVQTQLLLHDAYISLPGSARLVCSGRSFSCITHSFAATTPPQGISGALVDLGRTRDSLANVNSKIALVDGLAMAVSVEELRRAGAIGQVFVNGPILHEMISSPVWGSPGLADLECLPNCPVVSVTDSVAAELRQRIAEGTPECTIHAEVTTEWRQTPLLLAHVEGSDPDYVLFSGHIDSWHHGAMDNATANAVMIEIAIAMAREQHRMRRGLTVAFWSGHSHGRYSGSAWYADNYWRNLRAHCIAHVNIDSVGALNATVLSEGIAAASLRPLGARAISEVAGQEFRGNRAGRSGDQSFVGIGVPSLWMTLSEQEPSLDETAKAFAHVVPDSRSGGLGWWWHTVDDTIDKIDPDLLLRDARIYLYAIARLTLEAVVPLSCYEEVADLARRLTALRDVCQGRLDLSGLIDAIARLERMCGEIESRRSHAGPNLTAHYNRAVSNVIRTVLPVNYSRRGLFSHDPALHTPAVPLLDAARELSALKEDSDRARFLLVDLVRGRNELLNAIETATAFVEAALEGDPAKHGV